MRLCWREDTPVIVNFCASVAFFVCVCHAVRKAPGCSDVQRASSPIFSCGMRSAQSLSGTAPCVVQPAKLLHKTRRC